MKVHVQLPHGFGQLAWKRRFDQGQLIGVNEPDAYGYRQAEAMGADMSFSIDYPEGRIRRLFRLLLRWTLGFDLVHAMRNIGGIRSADVVWTHTESQFLGVVGAMTFFFIKKSDRPKIIAQSVWLIDDWYSYLYIRRWLWRRLINQVDVLTFLSPLNRDRAKTIFPKSRTEFVLFGIKGQVILAPRCSDIAQTFRIIAVGNDKRRDWAVLIDAVKSNLDWHLRIVSTTCPPDLAVGLKNIEIAGVSSNRELIELYSSADIAIVPLKPNLHASGITAIQEAALFGVPIIATRTGGLEAYFDDTMVKYVPTNSSVSLAKAINILYRSSDQRLSMSHRAQARMGTGGLSSEAYVRRHMQISERLIG